MTPTEQQAAERQALGARLRRERVERGWSQRQVAGQLQDALTGTQVPDLDTVTDYVKRWERGKVGVSPRYRVAYSAVFEIAEETLFAVPGDDVPVLRREFLEASAVTAGLVVASTKVAGRAGTRVGTGAVDRLRRRMSRLRRLDDVLGGGDTYRIYAAELSATRRLMKTATYSEETGRRLLGVLAEQAQQAGWAALDSGRAAAARSLFHDSLSAASEAGDPALMGNALALTAYQKVSAGAMGTAEADASCRMVPPDAPRAVRALLYERAAFAHAVAGSHHESQVAEALDKAEEALADDGAPDPDWASWVDRTELQIMTGRCWSTLHRPDRAVPALTQALARYDDAHARDKSLYTTWLVEALIDAGEITESARRLGHAIDLGCEVASTRPKQRVRVALRRLEPHRSVPAVAEVFEQARALSFA
ncbi:helix-turn-helix transcriptional regulator [Actinomadura miaoliensis]|uniref:Helix-turn-helix transcriptional regulator n=1 Tax=Actinomadura miaoliensis TaxID=430685 RepID=A0ABP7VBZ7_9ACTN